MSIHFSQSLDLEVEVEGSFSKGSKDYFDKGHGNWLPGDPDEAEIKHVWMISKDGKNKVDLLPFLSESDAEQIREEIAQLGSEEQ